MVHVLTNVLKKVHESLQPGGLLLITQPANEITRVVVSVDDAVVFADDLVEANFGKNLQVVRSAITNVVSESLFVPIAAEIVPAHGEYYQDEWASVEAWVEGTRSLSVDLDALEAMAANIRTVAGTKSHKLLELYRKEHILLRHRNSMFDR